jgi:exodeoxyribonuclease III
MSTLDGFLGISSCQSLKRKPPAIPTVSKLVKTSTRQTLLFPTHPKASGSGQFSKSSIRIACWNVNGLRSCFSKSDFMFFASRPDLDILCLNETKIQDEHIPAMRSHLSFFPYTCFNCSKAKLGYSGVAILSKTEPIRWDTVLENHPEEGRIVTAEFDTFYLVCTYVPNSGSGRFEYRVQKWDKDLRKYLNKLKGMGKGVVWIGDLNVINKDIDVFQVEGNELKAGVTCKERKNFYKVLKDGFVDSFRLLHPRTIKFSCFSNKRVNARMKNEGARVDLALVSEDLVDRLLESVIYGEVMGSDHHPIEIILTNSKNCTNAC